MERSESTVHGYPGQAAHRKWKGQKYSTRISSSGSSSPMEWSESTTGSGVKGKVRNNIGKPRQAAHRKWKGQKIHRIISLGSSSQMERSEITLDNLVRQLITIGKVGKYIG